MRFMILGVLIMAAAGGFYWFMAKGDFQTVSGISQQEALGRVGQVAGGVGGIGAVMFVVGLFKTLTGKKS